MKTELILHAFAVFGFLIDGIFSATRKNPIVIQSGDLAALIRETYDAETGDARTREMCNALSENPEITVQLSAPCAAAVIAA